MLIIAAGLAVALVAADLLSVVSRSSSEQNKRDDRPRLTERSPLADRARLRL
jgi:hypothetical protein